MSREEMEALERELRIKIMEQGNQIAIALAYLKAGQIEAAKLVLEGMRP